MNKKKFAGLRAQALGLITALGLAGVAQAQEAKTPYPQRAPLAEYLMTDQNAEIGLARSAAPESISGDATVVVLKQHGYETAVKGKNGFVCIVDSQGHWHPHLMFFGARSDGADWGADLPGSPVMLNPQFQGSPEPLATFMVAVDQWSDGTSAPIHSH